MRILVTCDLHYDVSRSRPAVAELARRVCDDPAEALVLVGDTAGADVSQLAECLRLFAGFGGRKFLVQGNHCLWCRPGEDSLRRYEHVVPEAAAGEGFHPLDRSPAVMGPVGLAGSIGWYDYSLRQEDLSIPLEFYRAKVAPGAAAMLEECRPLLEAHRALVADRQLRITSRWMDGVHVRLGLSDEEFLERVIARLREHLEELARRVERIIVFLHHVPLRRLVPYDRPENLAFAAAYMGSERLAQAVEACPKVTHVYCGHSHWPVRYDNGPVSYISIGSTYVEKRLEVLEL